MLNEFFSQTNWYLFLHLAGIIIGLGAVTVIDSLGFFSRKSASKTKTTIEAHHTTKPLIWIGTILSLVGWILLNLTSTPKFQITKSIIFIILILNGIFLSVYVSPRLDKLRNSNKILPNKLQTKIAISMTISFISWWSFVILSVNSLS